MGCLVPLSRYLSEDAIKKIEKKSPARTPVDIGTNIKDDLNNSIRSTLGFL
ncbi:hypothetical protein METP2_02996 [Methanosarcinales archaeon]|uniref:hypothetical protein n=1 Tax=Candidatus Methanoperedens sp. BLZ2 TaxID=2035255 RepID=UPI0015968E8D|nr:hypothetical protein [Candidatus Methanoperedens sp. BLZ2]MBZ0174993.1 hypothetical protein [Candidatus Methanoperedens nitroreducens]MCX9076611.1 hypothetical protein [Candidatus Methanoperedens sp.]MCX9087632.1 hypothetical protein [Candidatus Methanoperedens sp.]CAG0997125.1 hypothetical protein METP2_02996 [Methanosarcinales archaeon]